MFGSNHNWRQSLLARHLLCVDIMRYGRPPPPGGGGGGPLRVPAEAGGVYGVVRLSPPPQPARLLNQPACIAPRLRSGLRWLKRSGDDPVGCGC